MVKSLAPDEELDNAEVEGLATVAAKFYDMLARVRPELGKLIVSERRAVRKTFIVDAAVMMHGYAALMRDFNDSIGEEGVRKATQVWAKKLERFSASRQYSYGSWSGDLFEKKNPLWQRVGVVKPSQDGKSLTVLNTGGARSECGRVLSQLAALDSPPSSLRFLVNR